MNLNAKEERERFREREEEVWVGVEELWRVGARWCWSDEVGAVVLVPRFGAWVYVVGVRC